MVACPRERLPASQPLAGLWLTSGCRMCVRASRAQCNNDFGGESTAQILHFLLGRRLEVKPLVVNLA